MAEMRANATKDQWLDTLVGNLLRVGVLSAATIVLLGGTVYLWRHGSAPPHYEKLREQSAELRSVVGILGDVFSGSSRGTIQLGVLLLITTPIMRVLLLAIGFAWQRDRLYVVASVLVLLLLLYSLLGSG
ncbi:MAG: DUF1634 domain-containing protein [Planctomycetaceae bacterium]|nr:DUF1634 domain-containing protein [Planctomycetaceae bacterium]